MNGFLSYNPRTRSVSCSVLVRDGHELPVNETPLGGDWPVDEPPMLLPYQRVHKEDFVWGLTSDPTVLFPQVQAYHESLGAKSIGYQSVRLGTTVLGWIGYSFRSEEPPSAQQFAIVRTLSSLIALAVEREGIAERNRELALTRDRELQAKRVSDFMARTVSRLTNDADLERALECLLAELASAVGAAHVFLFRHDSESRLLNLELGFLDGRIRWGNSDEELSLWTKPFPDDISPAWRIMCEQRGLFTPTMAPIPPEDFAWPGAMEYVQKFELSDVAHIVLFSGDRPIGSIGFGFRDGRCLQQEDKTFIESVAQQASMVLRMLDLGVEAKKAAVAVEREAAAQERTAELGRANAALSRSVAAISESDDFDESLEKVFHEIVAAASADAGQLFLYDEVTNTLTTSSWIDENGRGRGCCPHSAPILQAPFDADITPAFRLFVHARDIMLAEHATLTQELAAMTWPGVLDWHTDHGRACAIPILIGPSPIGIIGLAWHSVVTFTQEQKELLFSLANQAALVIQLTRLAKLAGDAALNEQRAKFARDLHDTLAQGFTGILAQLGAASQIPGNRRSDIEAHITAVTDLARSSLDDARRSVRSLRLKPEPIFHLESSLHDFVKTAQLQTSAAVVLKIKGQRGNLAPEVETELCRIVQESLNNAVKHSSARHIRVSVKFQESNAVRISIRDDGNGFDLTRPRTPDSFGLVGMQERADLIGASLTLVSEPGRGAEIIVQYGRSI
jgi:signal transduction histidine kinase